MSHRVPLDIDAASAPFDQFGSVQWLAAARSGHASGTPARHQLYVARDRRTRANVLIKVTSKPGLVYEQDLINEIASLTTIGRELPDSPYFPVLGEHGRLPDSRVYLVMSRFDEWPLATAIGAERTPSRHAAHLRAAIEIATALEQLHGLPIWHVDLNPMNILCRWEDGRPVIRIVDFESSYEPARHARGVFYNPPTTTGYSAPELASRPPDARADLYSLGVVLYTMLAGYQSAWGTDVGRCVEADAELDPDLKEMLLDAVAPDPDNRLASIVEFRTALAGYVRRTWPRQSW